MALETQTLQTPLDAIDSDIHLRNGSPPQALIQEIATRRYCGSAGDWTADRTQATDFRSVASALEHARQRKLVMVQLVLNGNLTICEVIPSPAADSAQVVL